MSGKCLHCGEFLPRHITVRRKYCDDVCRVAYHRAKKHKTVKPAANSQELARLLDESVRINHSLRQSVHELRVNRTERLLERIQRLSDDNSRNILEIAKFVANS